MSPLTIRDIHEALEQHAPELTLSHQPIGGFIRHTGLARY